MSDTIARDREAMAALFAPAQVGPLALPNRFAMAPMTRCFAPNGIPGQPVIDYYTRRARGGVGLIITEGTSIPHPAAHYDDNVPRFHGEDALVGWVQVVDSVHAAGAKIIPQLWHVGAMPNRDVGLLDQKSSSNVKMGPSGYYDGTATRFGEAMRDSDIADVIAAYGQAAADARRIGFDGIEIHGAHGYLVDQFFWSGTNRRTDDWAGSVAGRARFAAEVARECRRRTASDFPIVLRFSQWKQQDYTARLAQDPAELEALLTPLVEAGVDIFHPSTRRYWTPEFDGSPLSLAGWTKKLTGKPAIIVGSVGLDKDMAAAGFARDAFSAAADLAPLAAMFARGEFDVAAVGRAIIANPDWCNLIRAGRWRETIPYSASTLTVLA